MARQYVSKLSDFKFDEIPFSDSRAVLRRLEGFYYALCKARNANKIVTLGIFSSSVVIGTSLTIITQSCLTTDHCARPH